MLNPKCRITVAERCASRVRSVKIDKLKFEEMYEGYILTIPAVEGFSTKTSLQLSQTAISVPFCWTSPWSLYNLLSEKGWGQGEISSKIPLASSLSNYNSFLPSVSAGRENPFRLGKRFLAQIHQLSFNLHLV